MNKEEAGMMEAGPGMPVASLSSFTESSCGVTINVSGKALESHVPNKTLGRKAQIAAVLVQLEPPLTDLRLLMK